MAYGFVASVSVSSAVADTGNSSAIDTSGATLLVVAVAYFGSTPTLSDSKFNTWTLAASIADGSGRKSEIYYAENPVVGTGHTFRLSGTTSAPALAVTAWSGAATSSPGDQVSSGNSASATTVATGSLTPTEDNELVIAAAMCEGTTNPPVASIDGGFTIQENLAGVASNAFAVGQAYLVQTTATAANPTWTLGSSQNTNAIAVSFKAASSGGSGQPMMRRWAGVPFLGGNQSSGRSW